MVKGLPFEWGPCFRTVPLWSDPIALSYWENTIAIGGRHSDIIILDAIIGSQMAILSGHTDWVRSITFSSDGRSLVSGSDDTTVKFWDMQTGGTIKTFLGHNDHVCSVSISEDCTRIVSGSEDFTIRLWDIQVGECLYTIRQQGSVEYVSFSPTEPQHIMSISRNKAWEWDINGQQISSLFDATSIAFSPDHTQLALCYGRVVTVQNSTTREVVAQLYVTDEEISYCCFSPDGRLVAAIAGKTAHVWNITAPDPCLIETFVGHTGNISSLVFPSPSILISASYDKSVRFWEIGLLSSDLMMTQPRSTSPTSPSIQPATLQEGAEISISNGVGNVINPGQAYFHFLLYDTNVLPVELLEQDIYSNSLWVRYQHSNQNGYLYGMQDGVLEVIKIWAKDSNKPPILWLNGCVGTGKTTIAQSFMEWCNAHAQLSSSFFCPYNPSNYNNSQPIFALAVQLAQKHPEVQSALVALLQSNPDIVYQPTHDQVEKLIVTPLKLIDIPTIVVIDALDDWMNDASQSAFLSAIESWIQEIPKVKFFITSQPKPHILASFYFPILSGLVDIFDLNGTISDLVNDDIKLFLNHKLAELAKQKGVYNWPTTTQLDLLCNRAAGLFVYAVATVMFLDNTLRTPDKQYAIIERSPDDTIHEGIAEGAHRGLSLDSLCNSIFQASFRNNDAEDDAIVCSVLACVVLAAPPLPPSAIADLIHIEVEEVLSILGLIQPLLRLHEDPNQPVHPVHKLLSDLLTSPIRCVDNRFYISPGKYHSELALNCLKLMNEAFGGNFSFNSQDSIGPEVKSLDKGVALKYACTSWHNHLSKSREDIPPLIPTLLHFLEDKLAQWLEVLGVSGVDPVVALNKTIFWLHEVCLDLF